MSGRLAGAGTATRPRERPKDRPKDRPWGAYVALGFLTAIIATGLAMPPGHGPMFPTAAPRAPLQASRQLRFIEEPDGALSVINADTRTQIALVPPKQNGFLHGLAHGLAATRRRAGVDISPPYSLALYGDGRLILKDASTRTSVDIEGFGPTNEAGLLRLLGSPGAPS